MKILGAFNIVLAGLVSVCAAEPGDWHPATAPMMTRWAAAVGPSNALPEYPRPQPRPTGLAEPERPLGIRHHAGFNQHAAGVCGGNPGSVSGGIRAFRRHDQFGRALTSFWYQRRFSVPETWRGQQVRLHFGAVDWRCQSLVRVNGHDIGRHEGGYDAFTFDITDALRWTGNEEVTCRYA